MITDKVNVEMPSPYAGVLGSILVGEGQTVAAGTPIALIEEAGAAASAAAPPRAVSTAGAPAMRPATAAARRRTRAGVNARELADSLYADLYGTRSTDGRRISKLDSFTGRGSLEGWLRAVMAQEYVNRFRRQQRLVSLEEQAEAGAQFEAETADPAQAIDARLHEATDEALGSLAAEDRFILANYYLDGRRLAEIARLMGVHESTISRKIEKITAWTRKAILSGLMKRGMNRKEAEQTMEVEVTELSLDVRRRLMQEKGEQTVP